jgi:hypothetical protein
VAFRADTYPHPRSESRERDVAELPPGGAASQHAGRRRTVDRDEHRGRQFGTVPGCHGLVFVDRDLLAVVRIARVADLPADFPMQQMEDTLDYDLAAIGGHEYLLPLKAVVLVRARIQSPKNEVEFRLYRKFTVESTITFETPEALPEDQTKEQPAK